MKREVESLRLDGWAASEKEGQDRNRLDTLKTSLTSARRRESRLLRRLGERALQILTDRGSLSQDDPETRILLEELHESRREQVLLEDRLGTMLRPDPSWPSDLPSSPGADSRFPFSR